MATETSPALERMEHLKRLAEARQNQNPYPADSPHAHLGHRYTGRLSPSSWTPLHLQLLLHYYTMVEHMVNHTAPAVLAYTEDLLREQLIERVAGRKPAYHPFRLTKRGEAHVKALVTAPLPSQAAGMTNLCQEVVAEGPSQLCVLGGPPNPVPVTKVVLDVIMSSITGECVRYAACLPVMIEEPDGGTITGFQGPFLLLEDAITGTSDREQFLICFPDQDGPGFTLKRTIPEGLSGDISTVLTGEQEGHPFLVWDLSERQWSRALRLLPDYQQRRARVARIATEGDRGDRRRGRGRLPSNPFATDYSFTTRPADYSTAVAIRRRTERRFGGGGLKSDTHGPPDSHGS